MFQYYATVFAVGAMSFLDVSAIPAPYSQPEAAHPMLNLAAAQGSTRGKEGYGQDAPRYDVGKFDVVGIRLGMKPAEVRRILKEKGFTISEGQAWSNFAKDAAAKARELNQPSPGLVSIEGPGSIRGYDPHRNSVNVEFIQLRDGPVVSTVTLALDRKTNDVSSLGENLIERYGAPTKKVLSSYDWYWCDIQREDFCNIIVRADAPQLSYSLQASGSLALKLTDWPRLNARRDAEIAGLFAAPTSDHQRALLGI